MTVRTFLVDQWLPAMRLSNGPTTLEGYRGNIERYIVPRVGDLPLRALTPPLINQLYADVRENGRIRSSGPLALKTVREVHVTLHRALEDAVRWDCLETNPSDRASAPSATAARNERRRRVLVLVGGQPCFKDAPKSAHGFRTISLPPKVTELLVELCNWQAQQPRLRAIPPEQALVFCRHDERPSVDFLERRWERFRSA